MTALSDVTCCVDGCRNIGERYAPLCAYHVAHRPYEQRCGAWLYVVAAFVAVTAALGLTLTVLAVVA